MLGFMAFGADLEALFMAWYGQDGEAEGPEELG